MINNQRIEDLLPDWRKALPHAEPVLPVQRQQSIAEATVSVPQILYEFWPFVLGR